MNMSYTLQPCHGSQCIIYIILVFWNLMHLWTILMKIIRPVLYFILCDFLSNSPVIKIGIYADRLNLGSIFILDQWGFFKPFFLNYDFLFSEWYMKNAWVWFKYRRMFRLSMSSKMIYKLWANYEIWIIVVCLKKAIVVEILYSANK